MIPQGDDSPGGRFPKRMTPGAEWSRTRLLVPSGPGFESPSPLGPKCDPAGQTCCGADFGSRIKISGHPLVQPASFFEIYPFRPGRGQIFLGVNVITLCATLFGLSNKPMCHPMCHPGCHPLLFAIELAWQEFDKTSSPEPSTSRTVPD